MLWLDDVHLHYDYDTRTSLDLRLPENSKCEEIAILLSETFFQGIQTTDEVTQKTASGGGRGVVMMLSVSLRINIRWNAGAENS